MDVLREDHSCWNLLGCPLGRQQPRCCKSLFCILQHIRQLRESCEVQQKSDGWNGDYFSHGFGLSCLLLGASAVNRRLCEPQNEKNAIWSHLKCKAVGGYRRRREPLIKPPKRDILLRNDYRGCDVLLGSHVDLRGRWTSL